MDKTQMDQIENEFIKKQKEQCQKYGSEFLESPFNKLVGIALESFSTFNMPINGLRHPIQSEHSSNWYIWAGDYSEAGDFFKPVHAVHLLEFCPKALKYLGLAPGWRFLFDNIYEDVWYDEKLLHI
ncbi:immunity protein Imm33 domain-containing protein [Paraflavitalea speifideaquila]|uniref:immunity protein Imm33 domain-containing protein n=1 Tax=Paraflavitalea speifideaquila TaxID=3076558 RepID=UPI0028F00109|nr:hypothetical protein [Paraflavitalea speifideiaquila]